MGNQPSFVTDLVRASWPVLIVGAAVAGYIYFGRPPQAKTAEEIPVVTTSVSISEVLPFTDSIQIKVDGVAQPHRHIKVAAEVAGRIAYKDAGCNDGKFVRGGTMLYQIDPAEYESKVNRIAEDLRQKQNAMKEWSVDRENALSQIELAENDFKFAQNETNRIRQLHQDRAVSDSELEKARRAEVTALLNLQSLRNQVRTLDARKLRAESEIKAEEIALDDAKRDLTRTKVLAPVDCVVVTDDVEAGDYVSPGTVLAVINDVQKAEVGCQLELDDLYWLWEARSPEAMGDRKYQPEAIYDFPAVPVQIEFPFHDRLCRWEGTISRLGGTGIDLSTRTIPCRVIVDEPFKAKLLDPQGTQVDDLVPPPLAAGMFVAVKIPIRPRIELLQIPANGVRSGGVVWLVRDGKLAIVPVKVARRMADSVLVHVEPNGVAVGEHVIISPLAVANEGMPLLERVEK